jgi:hypothetical protein
MERLLGQRIAIIVLECSVVAVAVLERLCCGTIFFSHILGRSFVSVATLERLWYGILFCNHCFRTLFCCSCRIDGEIMVRQGVQ